MRNMSLTTLRQDIPVDTVMDDIFLNTTDVSGATYLKTGRQSMAKGEGSDSNSDRNSSNTTQMEESDGRYYIVNTSFKG